MRIVPETTAIPLVRFSLLLNLMVYVIVLKSIHLQFNYPDIPFSYLESNYIMVDAFEMSVHFKLAVS